MTRFIMLSARNSRVALFDKRTEKFVGLLIMPLPGETAYSFSHAIGPLHYVEEIVNMYDFPELSDLQFFAIEYCQTDESL